MSVEPKTYLPFPPGIRQITVEVSRFGPNWKPEMFICRIYGLNLLDRMPTGYALAPSPSAAIRRALDDYAKKIADPGWHLPTEKEVKKFRYNPSVPLAIDDDLVDLI